MKKLETSGSQAHKDLLNKLHEEFSTAEKLAKKVEEVWRKAAIPAINELRYAGQHSIKYHAAVARGEDANVEDIQSAISHCRRASYEACDAGINQALNLILQFRNDFKTVPITPVLPNWNEICQRCDDIRDDLASARAEAEDRTPDHQKFIGYFEELVKFERQAQYARDELNKAVDEYNDRLDREAARRSAQQLEENKAARRHLIQVIFAILAIFLTVLGIVLSLA